MIVLEKEIIEIIKEEIDRLDKLIKEDSKLINNNRDVYNILKPKGKVFQTINVIKLSDNKELLNKLVNLVGSSNLVAVEDMIKKKIEFDNYDKEVNEILEIADYIKQKGEWPCPVFRRRGRAGRGQSSSANGRAGPAAGGPLSRPEL